ncbi:MAG: Pr6Pr family membrane protein [Janthinobacterium lividum]
MNPDFNRPNKIISSLIATIAWLAVVWQFFISVPNYLAKGRTPVGAFIQLLSYFTIESNLLIATSLTVIILLPNTKINRFFSKISTTTAIAVYIFIVSLVYNLVLRPFWHPKSPYQPDDELLHLIVPILYIFYWLFFLPKQGLAWKQLPGWLLFPALYLVYILVRGALSGFYPYFFLDVKSYGYLQVLINSAVLLVVFSLFCALFILIGRSTIRKNRL